MAPTWNLLRNPWSSRSAARRSAAPVLRARPHLELFEDRLALNYSFGGTALQSLSLTTADPAVFTLINHADDLAVPVNLGSNQFNFYGTTYQGSSLFVSSNGLITFGSGNTAYQNNDLTLQPFQAGIAPLWTDWYKSSGGPMLLGKFDTAHNDLILQWDQILHQQSTTPVTFQVVLQLNTGNVPGTITVNYLAINTGDRNANGGTSTVGVKDVGFQGANRVLVSFNNGTNPLIQSGQALQFTWNNPGAPPSLSSLSQTTAPEGSTAQMVTVTGANFVSNSAVQVNGSAVATSFNSATQLQALIPAAALTEEGSLAVSVINPGSQVQISNVLPYTVTDAPLSAAGTQLSATEGVALPGTFATFTDANPNAVVYDYQATIVWGDGQSCPGTISANGQGGFTVTGTHTYDEGIYPVSVRITDTGGATTTASSTVSVGDAPLTATAVAVSGAEGLSFTGPVATFTDANPNAPLSDFSATITWAPGQTSAGRVAVNPAGGFLVSGTYTYAEEGTYPVSVAITDGGGASAQVNGSTTVTDAPLTAAGLLVNTVENSPFALPVATFTDANPNVSLADYQVTIGWGDGQSSPGTLSLNNQGVVTVLASHAYAEEGSYPLSVQINDAGGAAVTASGTAFVADAPLTAAAALVSATEGTAFTGTVATFTDANPNAPLSDFAATITWAPGQTTPGTVTANPAGGFLVTGTFTYAEEGTYPISVAVTDGGGASAQVTGSAAVTDASLSATGLPINAVENTPFTLPVATFTDADPNASLTDYQATIGWGDGQSSPGTLGVNSQGVITVVGSHSYAEEGSYLLSVQINDAGGATANASGTAFVADTPLTAVPVTVNATEGAGFSGTVATFTDANPNATVGDFSATITWAPGQTTKGTITVNPAGGFNVAGTFTYAEEGTDPVSVAIADLGGASAQTTGAAVVADAALAAQGTAVSTTEGTSFSGSVAAFTDANPTATAADFTATITWGDGQTSAGTVTANPAGGFLVSGTNTYAEEGSYAVLVSVADQGGATAAASTTTAVADAPLTATSVTISIPEASAFHGVVATFTDANPAAVAAEFTANILWGDGATSAGAVTANADGSFAVSGDHTYALEGSYPVAVTVLDQGGSTATAYSLAQVTDSIPTVNAWLFQGGDPQRVYLLVYFTDLEREHHSLRIDWGDGSVTRERMGVSPEGFRFLTHRYSERFVEHHLNGTHIVVTVADGGGTTSDPEVLAVEFHHHHPW